MEIKAYLFFVGYGCIDINLLNFIEYGTGCAGIQRCFMQFSLNREAQIATDAGTNTEKIITKFNDGWIEYLNFMAHPFTLFHYVKLQDWIDSL